MYELTTQINYSYNENKTYVDAMVLVQGRE